MIQPNAKCVVNGGKVNEIALWLNQFIALKNEEFKVVDANNTPAKRWFLTGAVPGGVGAAESGDRNNLGGTGHGAAGTGGGASGNRDQLNPAPAGGNAGGPVGGGDTGQGGNVNPPANIDVGGTSGGASGNRNQLTMETAQGRALIKQFLNEGIAFGRSGDRSSFEAWFDKYDPESYGGSDEDWEKNFAEEIRLLRKYYNRRNP